MTKKVTRRVRHSLFPTTLYVSETNKKIYIYTFTTVFLSGEYVGRGNKIGSKFSVFLFSLMFFENIRLLLLLFFKDSPLPGFDESKRSCIVNIAAGRGRTLHRCVYTHTLPRRRRITVCRVRGAVGSQYGFGGRPVRSCYVPVVCVVRAFKRNNV